MEGRLSGAIYVLQEKYLVGAALEETGEMIRYTGYDTVLDQKVFCTPMMWKSGKLRKRRMRKIYSDGLTFQG